MKLSSLSIRRPVTVLMLTLIVIIIGVFAFTRLNVDLFPKFSLPMAVVITGYEGAGPREVETIVTENLERSLATVANVKSINSQSSEGSSMIMLEFIDGTDMDIALMDLRDRLGMVTGYLPDDISDPLVLKIDPSMLPLMNIGIADPNMSMVELNEWVDKTLKPRLERLDGVASVNIQGGMVEEVKITVNQQKLLATGFNTTQIAQALMMENMNMPGGIIRDGSNNLTVRSTGSFTSIEDIKNVPIMSQTTGATWLLKDLADVSIEIKDRDSLSFIDGVESLIISIQKESTANTVEAASLVHDEIEILQNEFTSVEVVPIMDQSQYINDTIGTVTRSGLIGILLAVVILFLFLKRFAPTLIIGIAIPISVIFTFTMIFFSDITLNMISLGGLVLGIGMMVDNSIVVLENIYRLRQEGYSAVEAADKGASQVTMAIVASTLTTVSIFAPIIFMQGMIADMFKELAMTITFSLLASLIVALTLVPMLSSKLLRDKRMAKPGFLMKGLNKIYKSLLRFSLKARWLIVLILIVLTGFSVYDVMQQGSEFFPMSDQGRISISIELPKGSNMDSTNEIVWQVADRIEHIDEIKTLWVEIGGSGSMLGLGGGNTNRGTVTALIGTVEERERDIVSIGEEIRAAISNIPGAEISVDTGGSSFGAMTGGAPISIEIQGSDLDVLRKIALDLESLIADVDGAREVKANVDDGAPELQISLNRDRAAQYALNMAMVSQSIQAELQGMVATRYKVDGRELDVRIVPEGQDEISLNDIKNMVIVSPLGMTVRLDDIAELNYGIGPTSISRKNQERMITINAAIADRSLGEVSVDIEKVIESYDMPDGYTYHIGGEQEQYQSAVVDLLPAIALGIVLVYMIMASQFESIIHPTTILFILPLALVGVVLALKASGEVLSVPAYLGMLVLVGVVVNNGIVLVDYINRLRREGMERNEAILAAGPTRLRPILMTTLTTVLALVPMAISSGTGAEMERPMAITIIGGLTFATLLTLLVVPVFYTLNDDLSSFIKRLFKGKKTEIVKTT